MLVLASFTGVELSKAARKRHNWFLRPTKRRFSIWPHKTNSDLITCERLQTIDLSGHAQDLPENRRRSELHILVNKMGRIYGTSMTKYIILAVIMVMALNFTQITGSTLAETDGVPETNTHLDDTVRADPLDKLKKYRGGYDITNKHYWSSTAFTGIYGYSIAALWLLCGLAYGVYLLVTNTCWKRSRKLKKRSPNCYNQCYLQPLVLALLFTILAITGCGLVLGGNAKFHSRAETVIDIIIDAADDASDTLYNTTGALKEINTTLRQVAGSSEATHFLTRTSRSLDTQAADIQRQAAKHRHAIHKGLSIVYIVTTVTISLVLISAIALLVIGLLKFRRTLQVLIAFCWIFTGICWLFFGIYFFLNNFAGDTCTAFESFQQNPYNNSLSTILPCDELLSAESSLDEISEGIYDIVNQVNHNLSTSYGNIVQICNPFSPPPWYDYQPWECSATSIQIGDIPQVLRALACPDTGGQTCNGGILLPAEDYNRVNAYSTSIQRLLDVYPGMQSLLECQTVENAFDEILKDYCKPLKRYARMVWISLVFLSVVMLALVLIWTTQVHHDQNHHSLGSSVKPHSTTAHTLESETVRSIDLPNPV